MNPNTIADLYRHMGWADAMVWASVLAAQNGQADEKLRGYLYHLHLVQHAFLRAWRGEPLDTPYPTFEDARALMGWARDYHAEAQPYVAGLGEPELAQPMPVAWASMVERHIGRPPAITSTGETALQVALHSTYHRGQVNARLRELGGTPPSVDYIIWLWLGRPAAEWPSLAG
jgi:uncharacterized damage-inducible protein DinB